MPEMVKISRKEYEELKSENELLKLEWLRLRAREAEENIKKKAYTRKDIGI